MERRREGWRNGCKDTLKKPGLDMHWKEGKKVSTKPPIILPYEETLGLPSHSRNNVGLSGKELALTISQTCFQIFVLPFLAM